MSRICKVNVLFKLKYYFYLSCRGFSFACYIYNLGCYIYLIPTILYLGKCVAKTNVCLFKGFKYHELEYWKFGKEGNK